MKPLKRPAASTGEWRGRSGFTLMEVLLTLILSAVLLLVLWSLFGTYTRLFESGHARVERVRVVRAVMRQFSDDLSTLIVALNTVPAPERHSASDDPFALNTTAADAASSEPADSSLQPASVNTSAAGDGDAFLFVGTEHSLLVDLLTSPPPHLLPDDGGAAFSQDAATASGPRFQEFQTVLYTFEDPLEAIAGDAQPPAGLVRRQLRWELSRTARFSQQTAPPAASSSLPHADLFAARGFAPLSADELVEAEFSRDDITWAKEVSAFRLRYFDGQDWRREWDSRVAHQLPRAVEILIQLQNPRTQKDDAHNGAAPEGEMEHQPLSATGTGTEEAEFGDPDQPVLRQVFPLSVPSRAHRNLEDSANVLSLGGQVP